MGPEAFSSEKTTGQGHTSSGSIHFHEFEQANFFRGGQLDQVKTTAQFGSGFVDGLTVPMKAIDGSGNGLPLSVEYLNPEIVILAGVPKDFGSLKGDELAGGGRNGFEGRKGKIEQGNQQESKQMCANHREECVREMFGVLSP